MLALWLLGCDWPASREGQQVAQERPYGVPEEPRVEHIETVMPAIRAAFTCAELQQLRNSGWLTYKFLYAAEGQLLSVRVQQVQGVRPATALEQRLRHIVQARLTVHVPPRLQSPQRAADRHAAVSLPLHKLTCAKP